MNRLILLLSGAFLAVASVCPLLADTKVTLNLVVEVPSGTPPGQPLFLGSNANGWNPADPGWRLPGPSGGVSRAAFSLPRGFVFEFKVTRGSWETVEKGTDGQEIPNRTWTADQDSTLTVTVGAWRDALAPGPARSTVTGRVDLVTDGPGPPLGGLRTLRIRLPDGYDGSASRYPVVYLMDGQNLFDASTSFAGEWKIDETLTELENQGKSVPAIVVGIDNAGSDRLREYSPYPDLYAPVSGGKEFSDWLVKSLKPWIDARYRTLPDPLHTSIGGSSMGGLIAVYSAFRHPGVFGQAASFSGAFWFGNRGLLRDLKTGGFDPKTRVYLDVGTQELGADDQNRQMVQDTRDVAQALSARGVGSVKLVVDEGAAHNEGAWSRRFGPAYLWMVP